VSPRLRLGWLGANFDRFQEAGVVAPLDVHSRSVSAVAGAAEVQFAYDLVAERGRRIALLGTVGYERWFGVSGYEVEAELAGNTALPFTVRAAKPTGPGLLVGAGLAGSLGETLQVSVDYRGAFGEANARRHEGRVGVQYRF
jgi:outer membrane autotransporter protein